MKRYISVAVLVASVAVAQSTDYTQEVLVLTTSTAVPSSGPYQKGMVVQNLGPNAIFCAMGEAAVLNKGIKIESGGSLSLDLGYAVGLQCITTVNQVTGAATVVLGVPR